MGALGQLSVEQAWAPGTGSQPTWEERRNVRLAG
jgi:hypothetical protein